MVQPLVRMCVALLLVSAVPPLVAPQSSSSTTFDYSTPSDILRTTTDGRIRGARNRSNKDFVLGGLFPIHAAEEGGGACGEVRRERGLERMEAMLFAIDSINSDDSLLEGLSLGYDIRDTCNSENIGLDETVDLVITGSQLDIESCQSAISVNSSDAPPTTGIVGAAASRVSVPVASLVRLFTTPQISYASSTALLSNRDRYEYFLRTIPPDNLQARAMVDLMLHFDWTYVSTIYSLNPYGEPGINEFQELAAAMGICIDLDVGIEDDFTEQQFADLAQELVDSQANIVILFTSQDNAEQLLGRIAATSAHRRFTWIASDAWARSINVVHQFNETAAGLYGFAPLTEHLDTFQEYFSRLSINSNQRNPWFKEFYAAVANCTANSTSGSVLEVCDEDTSVTDLPRYEQGNFIPLVVDAVYTYAHAIQNYLDEYCVQPLQWHPGNRTCSGQNRSLTGQLLLEYIQEVDFLSLTDNRVLFDNEGNVEGRYEVLNYQASDATGQRKFAFRRVAVWDSSITNDTEQQALLIDPSAEFQFGLRDSSDEILTTPPTSQCDRCGSGQYRREVPSSCCGLCEACLGAEFVNDTKATACDTCEGETWGNAPLLGSNGCVSIEESFLRIDHPYSIIIAIMAIVGLMGVVFTAVVFVVFWKTPVVKSSGREQMTLLLIGIATSFVSAFFFVAPPSLGVCGMQRWIIWTGFSIMFGALLVKIIRVARIFLGKKSLSRLRFTEPYYQVIFTCIIVLVQWVIIIISLAVRNPSVQREIRLVTEMPNEFPRVIVTCLPDAIAFLALSIGYETILIIGCTILGALSFSYPENFNEAKYVAFCSLSILVIWIAFIITYIATQSMQEFQNIAISLAVVMTAYSVLLCLFGPKLIIVLFRPKKNATSKLSHHGTGTADLNSTPLNTTIIGDNGMNRLSMPYLTPSSTTGAMEMTLKGTYTHVYVTAGLTHGIYTRVCHSRLKGNMHTCMW